MTITLEFLENEKRSLAAQRENAQGVVNQATGAVMLIDLLIGKLKEAPAPEVEGDESTA